MLWPHRNAVTRLVGRPLAPANGDSVQGVAARSIEDTVVPWLGAGERHSRPDAWTAGGLRLWSCGYEDEEEEWLADGGAGGTGHGAGASGGGSSTRELSQGAAAARVRNWRRARSRLPGDWLVGLFAAGASSVSSCSSSSAVFERGKKRGGNGNGSSSSSDDSEDEDEDEDRSKGKGNGRGRNGEKGESVDVYLPKRTRQPSRFSLGDFLRFKATAPLPTTDAPS